MPFVSSGVEFFDILDGSFRADGGVRQRLVADVRLPVELADRPLLRQLQVQQDSDVLTRVVLQEQGLHDASLLTESAHPVYLVKRSKVLDHLPRGALEVEVQTTEDAHDRVLGGTVEEAHGAAHSGAGEGKETRR